MAHSHATGEESADVAILVASPDEKVPPPTISAKQNEPERTPPYLRRSSGGHLPEESSAFSCKKFLRKRLPILKWLPKYNPKSDIIPDAIAGVTVGLTAIPQSMAYANVGGLSPEYGLYSSFVPSFVYIFLGSCRQMTIGPTALMELLVYEKCGSDFPQCVVLLGFWVGVIQFLMGLLKLGAVVSLISDPVTIGFVAGASLTISSSQLRSFLGLSGPKGSGFIGYCRAAIENFGTLKWGDTCLGVGCVLALLLFKNLKDYVKPSETTKSGRIIAKLIWVLAIGRNALVVIFCSVLAASLNDPPFVLTGTVKSGFPPFGPPHFELPPWSTHEKNETEANSLFVQDSSNGTLTFWETWSELSTAPLMIAIISILQNVAIAKAFGASQSIDATQEMIALGISHVCASFFSAMPTAGSFTRSAVNEASGVRSPFGGIFTGLLVIFALSFLTRWFAYIPKASLAAVILCAVLPMIEYENILPMWRCSKLDVLTAFVTFLASLLLGMEYGIIIGVGVSLALYLIRPIRPPVVWSIMNVDVIETTENDKDVVSPSSIKQLSSSPEPVNDAHSACSNSPMIQSYHLIRPEQGFLFPSVDAIRTKINKLALRYPEITVIALDCGSMTGMDYTSASALYSLVKALKKTGKMMVFIKCNEKWVGMMRNVGLAEPRCFDSLSELDNFLVEKGKEEGRER